MKTASTPRRPTTKNCTRARARSLGVNTRRACLETTAKRTSKLTCTYDNRRRLESCSRDPIGFTGSKWSLYQYVSSKPTKRLDPLGLRDSSGGHGWQPSDLPWVEDFIDWLNPREGDACCNGNRYYSSLQGCCGGKKIYSKASSCCEDGQAVAKVTIKICRGKLGGDDSTLPLGIPKPIAGPYSHTYIICPDGKKYGKHPRPFCDKSGDFFDFVGSGPGYVNEEVDRDPSKAICETKKVCPATADRLCKEQYTDEPYNVACNPFGGTNCHSWGNCGSQ